MSWDGRTCRIFNVKKDDFNVAVFDNSSDEGTPIACASSSKYPGPHAQFHIQEVGGDKFIVKNVHYPWHVSANPDNLRDQNYPFTSLTPFVWSIEPAGPNTWKFHIPGRDECLYLPDSDDEKIRILIQPANGAANELWRIEPME